MIKMRINEIPKSYFLSIAILLWLLFSFLMYNLHKKNDMGDFIPLYTASKLTFYSQSIKKHMYDHHPIHFDRVNDSIFLKLTRKSGINVKIIHPYVYPPFFAWQMKPLVYFGFGTAKILFLIFNIIFFCVGFFLICKELNIHEYKILTICSPLIFYFFFPLKYSLGLGQTTPFIFFLISLSYYFMNRKHDFTAGLILGYCISIKISPIFIFLPLLLGRKYKLAFASVIAIISFFVSNILIFSWDLTYIYINRIADIFLKISFPAWNNVSFQAMLMRYKIPLDSVFWYFPVKPDFSIQLINITFILSIVIFSSISVLKNKYMFEDIKRLNGFIFCNGILLSLLVPKITWNHYFVYMLIPVLWILNETRRIKNKRIKIWIFLLTGLTWSFISAHTIYLASFVFYNAPLKIQGGFPSMIFSLPLIGGICIFVILNLIPILKKNDLQ